MNQSRCLPFILICCSVTFMFLSKDGGTCVSAENLLKIKASWAAWENLFSMQMCIKSRCQSGSPHNNLPMSQTEQKDAQTLSLGCFCHKFLTRERVTFRDLWRCPLLPSPPPPPPLPPTSHTSCTSWGRAIWRVEREREGKGGVERKTREEKQIKSHKLSEMSLLRCEKRREKEEKWAAETKPCR